MEKGWKHCLHKREMHFPLIENDVLLDGILIANGKNLLKGKGAQRQLQLKKKLK